MGRLGGAPFVLAFSSYLTSLSPQMPPSPPVHISGSQVTPKQFLASKPPGPYTCLRARGFSLLGTEYHLRRLCDSMRECGSMMDERMLAAVALEGIEKAVGLARDVHAVDEKDGDTLDCFVTIHASPPSPASESSSSSPAEQWDLSFHAVPMPFASVIPQPITLEVFGGQRDRPRVKHSQWLWDREEHEQHRVGPGGEVVLWKAGHNKRVELLEGLVTNFFVVRDGKLYTAPEGEVLSGHIRSLTMTAAREVGVPVVEQRPVLEEAEAWDEAFITGSGRLIVPVNRIQSSVMEWPRVKIPQAPGPLTNKIRQRVLYDINQSWEPIASLKEKAPAAITQKHDSGAARYADTRQ